MEMNIVIAGEAGQGAFSVELELTETLSRLNTHFFATKHYMSRVRGGHNYHMIRIADHAVHALRGGKWTWSSPWTGRRRRHKPNLREGRLSFKEMAKEVGVAAEVFGSMRRATPSSSDCSGRHRGEFRKSS
jgi:2-oxoglutarate ferredoxin oxidoreductase subunit alpha